jgi:hypothetical protein
MGGPFFQNVAEQAMIIIFTGPSLLRNMFARRRDCAD